MTHEIIQNQEIDFLHIDPLISDQHQLHSARLKTLFLDNIIVIENSLSIGLHHVQDTLNFLINEETLDSLQFFILKYLLSFFS